MATKSYRSSGSQHNQRGVAQGNTLVDPVTGLPIDAVVDTSGVRRLAVDASLSVDNANIDVDLDPADDGVHIGDKNSGNLLIVNSDGSINVNTVLDASDGDSVSIGAHQNQIFDEDADTINASTFQEIYSYTSASNDTKLVKVEATASAPATFRVKLNGTIIKEKRSSSLEKNVIFEFLEHRTLANTDILSVDAKIERFRLASYSTFTSIEGYLE